MNNLRIAFLLATLLGIAAGGPLGYQDRALHFPRDTPFHNQTASSSIRSQISSTSSTKVVTEQTSSLSSTSSGLTTRSTALTGSLSFSASRTFTSASSFLTTADTPSLSTTAGPTVASPSSPVSSQSHAASSAKSSLLQASTTQLASASLRSNNSVAAAAATDTAIIPMSPSVAISVQSGVTFTDISGKPVATQAPVTVSLTSFIPLTNPATSPASSRPPSTSLSTAGAISSLVMSSFTPPLIASSRILASSQIKTSNFSTLQTSLPVTSQVSTVAETFVVTSKQVVSLPAAGKSPGSHFPISSILKGNSTSQILTRIVPTTQSQIQLTTVVSTLPPKSITPELSFSASPGSKILSVSLSTSTIATIITKGPSTVSIVSSAVGTSNTPITKRPSIASSQSSLLPSSVSSPTGLAAPSSRSAGVGLSSVSRPVTSTSVVSSAPILVSTVTSTVISTSIAKISSSGPGGFGEQQLPTTTTITISAGQGGTSTLASIAVPTSSQASTSVRFFPTIVSLPPPSPTSTANTVAPSLSPSNQFPAPVPTSSVSATPSAPLSIPPAQASSTPAAGSTKPAAAPTQSLVPSASAPSVSAAPSTPKTGPEPPLTSNTPSKSSVAGPGITIVPIEPARSGFITVTVTQTVTMERP